MERVLWNSSDSLKLLPVMVHAAGRYLGTSDNVLVVYLGTKLGLFSSVLRMDDGASHTSALLARPCLRFSSRAMMVIFSIIDALVCIYHPNYLGQYQPV